MKIFIQFIVSILVLAIGAIVGIYVEKINSHEIGKIRYLDFKVNKSILLKAPTIQGKNLEVLLDRQPIKKLNQLQIGLYNFTDRDFENVPVYLELIPKSNETFSLVAKESVGMGSIPEIVEPMQVAASKIAGAFRAGYKIKTVNRGNDVDSPALLITYLFIGDIPNVVLSIDKKGVDSRKYDYVNFIRNNKTVVDTVLKLLSVAGIIFGTILFYGILIFVGVLYSKRIYKKEKKKYQIWLENRLSDDEIKNELATNKSDKNIASLFIELYEEHRWISSKPKFLRRFSAIQKPSKFMD